MKTLLVCVAITFLFAITADASPCIPPEQEDSRITNLCGGELFYSNGAMLSKGDSDIDSYESDCKSFFSRHPDAIEHLGRVVVVRQSDLDTEKMASLMSGKKVDRLRLLQTQPFCGNQTDDNSTKVILDQDDNAKKQGTLVLFPADLQEVMLESEVTPTNCSGFYHPVSSNEEPAFKLIGSINKDLFVGVGSHIYIDGFAFRLPHESTAQYDGLKVMNTSELSLRNLSFDSDSVDNAYFIRVDLTPGGSLAMQGIDINCRNYPCLEIGCSETSCPDTRIQLRDMIISMSNNSLPDSVRAIDISKMNQFILNDIRIHGNTTHAPIVISVDHSSPVNGCLSNIVFDSFSDSLIQIAANASIAEGNLEGVIGFYRNGYRDENNKLVILDGEDLIQDNTTGLEYSNRTSDCFANITPSLTATPCPSTSFLATGAVSTLETNTVTMDIIVFIESVLSSSPLTTILDGQPSSTSQTANPSLSAELSGATVITRKNTGSPSPLPSPGKSSSPGTESQTTIMADQMESTIPETSSHSLPSLHSGSPSPALSIEPAPFPSLLEITASTSLSTGAADSSLQSAETTHTTDLSSFVTSTTSTEATPFFSQSENSASTDRVESEARTSMSVMTRLEESKVPTTSPQLVRTSASSILTGDPLAISMSPSSSTTTRMAAKTTPETSLSTTVAPDSSAGTVSAVFPAGEPSSKLQSDSQVVSFTTRKDIKPIKTISQARSVLSSSTTASSSTAFTTTHSHTTSMASITASPGAADSSSVTDFPSSDFPMMPPARSSDKGEGISFWVVFGGGMAIPVATFVVVVGLRLIYNVVATNTQSPNLLLK